MQEIASCAGPHGTRMQPKYFTLQIFMQINAIYFFYALHLISEVNGIDCVDVM